MNAIARCTVGHVDTHFRDEIGRQRSLEAASTTLAEAAEALGWDLAAFHTSVDVADLPRSEGGTFIAERMGWSSTALEGWRRSKLARNCPIGAFSATVTEPFFWTCDDRDTSWFSADFSIEHRRVLHYYGRFVTSGVAVPVHRGACTGYVSWCTRDGDAREIASAHLGSLFFISHVFIHHIEGLLAAPMRERGSNHLTERELECLTWAARGKCEEAIALLLSRSRDTVHFHLQNAVKKLDAANRTHAVAIACVRGLINPR